MTGSFEMDSASVATLAAQLDGPVLIPGDAGFEDEIVGMNLATTHRPAIVAGATSAADVAAAVRFAVEHGLPVGVQATGHGAVAEIDGMLISTRRMNTVTIDAEAKTATVGAGVRWIDVINAAAPYGLAPLNGSSSNVGAVGYTLGGGLPVLGRTFGFAADLVCSFVVAPYSTGGTFVNMHGRPGDGADRAKPWPPATYERLRKLRAAYDPGELFRFGHAI